MEIYSMPGHARDNIDRMTIIMQEAQRIFVSRDTADRDHLKGLRLKMAGAMTSLQLLLDAEIGVARSRHYKHVTDLEAIAVRWSTTASEFRAFTAKADPPLSPSWQDYLVTARVFIRHITALNGETGRLLAKFEHGLD